MNTENSLSKSILFLALATAAILLIPLFAMQFSTEVVWTLSDFIFMGMLIFATGFTYLLATTKSNTPAYRVAVGTALATGFILIWSNLAVGIIGSEDNEFNLLYFGVVAIGIIGAVLVQFKAIGMMWTLFVMAAAQTVIATAALFTGMAEVPGSSVFEILAVNGFFITLFIVSALLFRHAAKEPPSTNEATEE